MSIEAQLDRLNTNIEALVGAIAANTSVASSIANNEAAAAPAPQAAPTRTRRTKAEIDAENAAKAPAPVVEAPQAAPAAEVAQAEENPFGEQTSAPEATSTAAYTLDDVRSYGLKLRDKLGMDKAKAVVAQFGVTSLADLPAAKYSAWVRKVIELTAEEESL
jgi:hypothetical protein